MNRRVAGLLSAIVLLVIAALTINSVLKARADKNSQRVLQEALAAKLDVKVDDYPYADVFPYGYFYVSLKPGMSTRLTHEVVKGYDEAWHCGAMIEIYYFYGTSNEENVSNSQFIKRYRMFYDREGKFTRFEGEDKNSSTIQLDGCEVGQLPAVP